MIKILLRGEIFSRNDNGRQCRRVIGDLDSREDIDLYLISTSGGDSGWIYEDDEERFKLDSCLKKTAKFLRDNRGGYNIFDVSLQIQDPSEWEQIASRNIGMFLGCPVENVPSEWVRGFGNVQDILTLDEYSKGQLEKIGQESETIGYGTLNKFKCLPESVLSDLSEHNFLVNTKWHPENDIEKVITAFVQEFMNEEVGLALRTSVRNHSEIDRYHTVEYLESLASMFPKDRKCKVHVLHGLLDRETEEGLSNNDKIFCTINCSHSLVTPSSVVVSYKSGTPVISPPTGFFSDLSEGYYRTENRIDNLKERHVTSKYLSVDDRWSYVDILDLRKKMREAYSKRSEDTSFKKNTEQDSDLLYNIIKKTISLKENKDETK